MNQTQEEYQTENGRFASSLEQLDFNIPQNTGNYQYLVYSNGQGGCVALNLAITRSSELKSYLGFIHYARGGTLTKALICESVDCCFVTLSGCLHFSRGFFPKKNADIFDRKHQKFCCGEVGEFIRKRPSP